MMLRALPRFAVRAVLAACVAVLVAASPLASTAQASTDKPAASKPAKTFVKKRVPRGVGFLPGYRTPEQIERQRYEQTQRERRAYYRAGGPRIAYWRYPQPQFYRGRWNGGGFGECWTSTPIGYQWNCGK